MLEFDVVIKPLDLLLLSVFLAVKYYSIYHFLLTSHPIQSHKVRLASFLRQTFTLHICVSDRVQIWHLQWRVDRNIIFIIHNFACIDILGGLSKSVGWYVTPLAFLHLLSISLLFYHLLWNKLPEYSYQHLAVTRIVSMDILWFWGHADLHLFWFH